MPDGLIYLLNSYWDDCLELDRWIEFKYQEIFEYFDPTNWKDKSQEEVLAKMIKHNKDNCLSYHYHTVGIFAKYGNEATVVVIDREERQVRLYPCQKAVSTKEPFIGFKFVRYLLMALNGCPEN